MMKVNSFINLFDNLLIYLIIYLVDEEVSTVEVFTPSFRPNPVIRYENIPLTKSTWTRQPCPLLGNNYHLFINN